MGLEIIQSQDDAERRPRNHRAGVRFQPLGRIRTAATVVGRSVDPHGMRTVAAAAAIAVVALLCVWSRQPGGSEARAVRYEAVRRQPAALTTSFAETTPARADVEDDAGIIPPALREIHDAQPQEDDDESPPPPPPHSLTDGCTAAASGCDRSCRARKWSVHCQRCECARCSFCAADTSSSTSDTELLQPPPPPPPARSSMAKSNGRARGRGNGHNGRNKAAAKAHSSYSYDDDDDEDPFSGEGYSRRHHHPAAHLHRNNATLSFTAAAAATSTMDPSTLIALGLLTQSKTSSRFRALTNTWLPHFQPYVMVFESHTDVSRVQQIWKYIPSRLYKAFPSMRFYLILDDDVFINRIQLLRFLKHRDHNELALYGPGFCEWGVSSDLKKQISSAISEVKLPQMMHIVIGGIMLFTSAAVKQFSDATVLMQCIDDLETLFANKIHLWDGLKDSAMYNQVGSSAGAYRSGWAARSTWRALSKTSSSSTEVLERHRGREAAGWNTSYESKRMLALWRAYERWAVKESGGSSGEQLEQRIVRSDRGKRYCTAA